MSHRKVCLYSYFGWCRYFHDPWVSFVTYRWVLSKGHKIYLKDWSLVNSQPTFLILSYFLTQGNGYIKESTSTRQHELHNSLKLSLTNIRALHSNFDGYEFFLKANSPDIHTDFIAPFYGWGSTASRASAALRR